MNRLVASHCPTEIAATLAAVELDAENLRKPLKKITLFIVGEHSEQGKSRRKSRQNYFQIYFFEQGVHVNEQGGSLVNSLSSCLCITLNGRTAWNTFFGGKLRP